MSVATSIKIVNELRIPLKGHKALFLHIERCESDGIFLRLGFHIQNINLQYVGDKSILVSKKSHLK